MTIFTRSASVRLITTFAKLTIATLIGAGSAMAQTASRDPWLRPFDASSIWNSPIRSSAIFADTGFVYENFTGPEPEYLVRTGPADPLRHNFQPAETFQGGPRRTQGTVESYFPWIQVPDWLVIPDSDPNPSTYFTPNNCLALVQPNGYDIIQAQPSARPDFGSENVWFGNPQISGAFPDGSNLFGPGRGGTHYGSSLSALGGSIRPGELTASNRESIRHAVKLLIFMGKYATYTTNGDSTPGYRWPALSADGYAAGVYGTFYDGNFRNPNIESGALLAIPRPGQAGGVDIDTLLVSEKAKKIAWALQNYGGYIVDDTYLDQYLIGVDSEALGEFDLSANDINTLFLALKVVTNNAEDAVGGGTGARVYDEPLPRFAYGGEAVGVYTPIANRIEAENYDVGGKDSVYFDVTDTNEGGAYRRDGVDVEPCGEGGFNVGYLAADEWIGYSINVPTAGNYNVAFRHAGDGGTVRFDSYATPNVFVSANLPATGGYQSWQTSAPIQVNLPAGNQTIYLSIISGGYNLNYFTITPVGGGTTTLINRATGGTATASSNPVAAETAPKAFDGNTGTKWLGNVETGTIKGWLQYQFGGGASYAITQYKITSANDAPERDPRNWQLQGSNNGTSGWTNIGAAQSSQTFTARFQTKTYNVTNSTAYRYYRLNITATNGPSNLIQLSEMQLLSP